MWYFIYMTQKSTNSIKSCSRLSTFKYNKLKINIFTTAFHYKLILLLLLIIIIIIIIINIIIIVIIRWFLDISNLIVLFSIVKLVSIAIDTDAHRFKPVSLEQVYHEQKGVLLWNLLCSSSLTATTD